MRLTTVHRYQQIIALYDHGKREPKTIAEKMHVSVDVVYRAIREVFHVKQSSTVTRRKNRANSQNSAK